MYLRSDSHKVSPLSVHVGERGRRGGRGSEGARASASFYNDSLVQASIRNRVEIGLFFLEELSELVRQIRVEQNILVNNKSTSVYLLNIIEITNKC